MKKMLMIVALILVLVMAIAGVGNAAAKYAVLTGTWTGSGNYAEIPGNFYGTWTDMTLIISDQDPNGNFFGTLAFGNGWFANPISGTIATNKEIMMSIVGGDDRVITIKGKLTGKKISATVQVFRPAGDITDTGKLVFTIP
jgi:hypothetical protein